MGKRSGIKKVFAFSTDEEHWPIDEDHNSPDWTSLVAKARVNAEGGRYGGFYFGVAVLIDADEIDVERASRKLVDDLAEYLTNEAFELAGEAAEGWLSITDHSERAVRMLMEVALRMLIEDSRNLYHIKGSRYILLEDLDADHPPEFLTL